MKIIRRIKTVSHFICNRARLRAAGYRLCLDGTMTSAPRDKPPRVSVNGLSPMVELMERSDR